jgi:hypothetical protein
VSFVIRAKRVAKGRGALRIQFVVVVLIVTWPFAAFEQHYV